MMLRQEKLGKPENLLNLLKTSSPPSSFLRVLVPTFLSMSLITLEIGIPSLEASVNNFLTAVGGVAGGLVGGAAGIASGDPLKAAQLTAGGIGFGVAVFALPGLVAKLITNPKRLATVERILLSEFKIGGRSAAISRLVGFIAAQTEKRKFGSQNIPSTIP